MRRIAHIINPVVVSPKSDLYIAQPITFASMLRAREYARDEVEVELYTAQYPEDRPLVPDGFTATPDLERSVLNFGTFRKPRKLPLIGDILQRLYQATDAAYLIYTNVDIGLQPHFYSAVNALIEQGFDAFTINRRTISNRFTSPAELPLIYAEVGEKHPGFDCFVFRREALARYKLAHVCLGVQWIDHTLLMNIVCYARRFCVFRHLHLTFHIGDSQTWLKEKYADYYAYNREQARSVLHALEAEFGPLENVEAFSRYKLGMVHAKQLLLADAPADKQFHRLKKQIKLNRATAA